MMDIVSMMYIDVMMGMHITEDIDRMMGMTIIVSICIVIDSRSMMGSVSMNEHRKFFASAS